uniref:Variant surface glycoprotein 1181 n=1 Tax=Trypanosoma brucei TaxID=5691 RepID=M4SVQ7_9TRYP|nr:variant surface glycoprotein 1181 [Trypanosoma brucei]
MQAVLWIAFLALEAKNIAKPTGATVTSDLSNTEAFSKLCGVYNALTAKATALNLKDEVESLAYDIGALNMSAAPTTFRDIFKPGETHTKADHPKRPSSPPETVATWDKYFGFWQQSASRLQENSKNRKTKSADGLPPYARAILHRLAEEAYSYATTTKLTVPANALADFQREAERAIYGGPPATTAADGGANGDRNAKCGTTAGAKGTISGTTLRNDFLCVCAGNGQGTTKKKTCCEACQDSGSTEWTSPQNGQTIFKTLAGQCSHFKHIETATPEAIEHATTALLQAAARGQTTNGDWVFILGKIEGSGTDGCKGESATNGGMCVSYRNSAAKTPDIAWLDATKKAATALRNLNNANKEAENLLLAAKQLNATAYNAVEQALAAGITKTTVILSQKETTTNCGELSTNKTACEAQSYKWQGKNETDGKCVATAKEQTNTAGTEGAATTETRKSKNKDDCKCPK